MTTSISLDQRIIKLLSFFKDNPKNTIFPTGFLGPLKPFYNQF